MATTLRGDVDAEWINQSTYLRERQQQLGQGQESEDAHVPDFDELVVVGVPYSIDGSGGRNGDVNGDENVDTGSAAATEEEGGFSEEQALLEEAREEAAFAEASESEGEKRSMNISFVSASTYV